MRTGLYALTGAIVLFTSWAAAAPENVPPPDTLYINRSYDASRNPQADLAAAVTRAQAEGKHVLLEVGGDWCGWCHVLDRFIRSNQDVHDALAQTFVVVKVNVSPNTQNRGFMANYPRAEGYPALYVLDDQGGFLTIQRLESLQQNDGNFIPARMIAFANRWRAGVNPPASVVAPAPKS